MEKQAILAVSFGTSYPETREKTIDRIEEDMRQAYPDDTVYRRSRKLWSRSRKTASPI